MANPPWHDPHGRPSPDARRSLALNARENTVVDWVRALTKWVLPGGTLTFALSAGRADHAFKALLEHGCGSLELYPFWPRLGKTQNSFFCVPFWAVEARFAFGPALLSMSPTGASATRPSASCEMVRPSPDRYHRPLVRQILDDRRHESDGRRNRRNRRTFVETVHEAVRRLDE